ncbi:MAG TPA: type II secretion system protein, partial [Candidatus Stercorousia faecigallinarum]|nr:type II secretion system protein [Candidatus Stercorousia faecigallinarum]
GGNLTAPAHSLEGLFKSFVPYQSARSGFTLAEVLITLGIIGVVAAMTMPVLISNYRESVIKNQFKKAYSLVAQSLVQIEVNNGYPLECYVWPSSRGGNACLEYAEDGNCKKWSSSTTDPYGSSANCDIFQQEFEKTVKIIKVCENNALAQGCIPEYNGTDSIVKQDNEDISDVDSNKQTAGTAWWRKNAIAKDRKAYVLADGTILLMSGWSGMRIFAIDVNGKRGPNKWGYDLFSFSVSSEPGKSLNLIPSYLASPVEKGGKSAKQMLSE